MLLVQNVQQYCDKRLHAHTHYCIHTCIHIQQFYLLRGGGGKEFVLYVSKNQASGLLLARTQSFAFFALVPSITEGNVTGVPDVTHNYR